MSSFSLDEQSDVQIIRIEDAAAINDFRSNAFRDALYEAIPSREDCRVVADIGEVDFLSSSGVAILVGLKRRVEALHGKLVVIGVQPDVADLLRITRLNRYFTFADDKDAAVAALRPLPTV